DGIRDFHVTGVQTCALPIWRAAALFHVAGRAGGDDVLPGRLAAQAAGHDVVERQMLGAAAVLAGEAVAQEHVEAREGGEFRMLRSEERRVGEGSRDRGWKDW